MATEKAKKARKPRPKKPKVPKEPSRAVEFDINPWTGTKTVKTDAYGNPILKPGFKQVDEAVLLPRSRLQQERSAPMGKAAVGRSDPDFLRLKKASDKKTEIQWVTQGESFPVQPFLENDRIKWWRAPIQLEIGYTKELVERFETTLESVLSGIIDPRDRKARPAPPPPPPPTPAEQFVAKLPNEFQPLARKAIFKVHLKGVYVLNVCRKHMHKMQFFLDKMVLK